MSHWGESLSGRTASAGTMRLRYFPRDHRFAPMRAILPRPALSPGRTHRDVHQTGSTSGLADGVRLVVDLLAGERHLGLRVELEDPLLGDREHAAGAGGGVVDGAYGAGLGEHLAVWVEEQVDHESDGVARREVLAGRLVGGLGETPDEGTRRPSPSGPVSYTHLPLPT